MRLRGGEGLRLLSNFLRGGSSSKDRLGDLYLGGLLSKKFKQIISTPFHKQAYKKS